MRFESWKFKEGLLSGYTLKFNLTSGVERFPEAMSRLSAFSECKFVEPGASGACVMDEDALAAKFDLPALKSVRVVDGRGGRTVKLGNIFAIYQFKDRHWLIIHSQYAAFKAGGITFGFLMHPPLDVASGRTRSLFEFGCQLEPLKAP